MSVNQFLFIPIQDTVVGSLGQRITTQLLGLKGLHKQLSEVLNYLKQVVDGTLPVNHTIVYHLQVIQLSQKLLFSCESVPYILRFIQILI